MKIKSRRIIQIVFAIVCLAIGTVLVLPAQAAKKSSAWATKSWTKKYTHSKSKCNKLFYSKTQSDALFYTKTSIDSLLANYYSKTDSDGLYYNKTDSDARYYTQSQITSNYYNKTDSDGLYYNKTDSDARYYTQSQITSNYYNKTDSDSRYVNTSGDSLSTTGITYLPAITKSITISAAALKPERSVIFDFADDKGLYLVSGNTEYDDDFGRASISLPDGAVVTKLTGYFYDNDGGSNTINAALARNSLAGSTDILASVWSTGTASPGYENVVGTSILYATVDNDNYSYYLYSFLSSSSTNLRIKGYKIEYQITTP